jgi:hypothetical protein
MFLELFRVHAMTLWVETIPEGFFVISDAAYPSSEKLVMSG